MTELPPWKSRSGREAPKFLKGHNFRIKGRVPHNYLGGLFQDRKTGRWRISCRDGTEMPFSRAMMEAHQHRPLEASERVHHISGDPSDDRIENLRLYANEAEHQHDAHAGMNYEALRRYHSQHGLSDKDYLNRLKDWIETHHQRPTYEAIDKDSSMPSARTYWRRFGSWPHAVALAQGLK